MEAHQLMNQDSGYPEYYTPEFIIEAARETMGWIDLDPATTKETNALFVKAETIFTKEDDGLSQTWFGNIWMNHPFGRKRNPLWINKLVNEYENGHVRSACCVTFASTSEGWFQPLTNYAQCYLVLRLKYFNFEGKKFSPPKGSVVTYLGPDNGKFYECFHMYGNIMTKMHL